MSTDKVLIVDDEPQIRRVMKSALTKEGYIVADARSGEEALDKLREERYDLIILDRNMPGMGGLAACRSIRTNSDIGIIMLTVRKAEPDKIEALDAGADDYITKPFSVREVMARVRSAVRRAQTPERPEDAPIRIGKIEVQPARRSVKKAGHPIRLTPKEYDILYYLMAHAGRAVTYGKLLSSVWGAQYREEVDYLRTFVRQLRKKIEDDPSNPVYLVTDACVGYRFNEEIPRLRRDDPHTGELYLPVT